MLCGIRYSGIAKWDGQYVSNHSSRCDGNGGIRKVAKNHKLLIMTMLWKEKECLYFLWILDFERAFVVWSVICHTSRFWLQTKIWYCFDYHSWAKKSQTIFIIFKSVYDGNWIKELENLQECFCGGMKSVEQRLLMSSVEQRLQPRSSHSQPG